VQATIPGTDLAALRPSINRGRTFGEVAWSEETATSLNFQSPMRPPSRPRKRVKDKQFLLFFSRDKQRFLRQNHTMET